MSLLSRHGKAGIFYPKTYQLPVQNIAASYGKLCRKSTGTKDNGRCNKAGTKKRKKTTGKSVKTFPIVSFLFIFSVTVNSHCTGSVDLAGLDLFFCLGLFCLGLLFFKVGQSVGHQEVVP